MITKDKLTQATTANKATIDKFYPFLVELMPKYGIDTELRQQHFLAQLLHESGAFRYVRELASGKAYEGRKDLGNIEQGDGVRFRGRGLIQITGRANYSACSKALFGDERLLKEPDILETPRYAVESACWFWKSKNLNALADTDDIKAITKKINGGYNGLADRQQYLLRLK